MLEFFTKIMKNILLSLAMAIALLFATSTINVVHAQNALTVQAGYSWTMGMVGVAYQFNYIEIGGGIMPSTMPGNGDPITSLSAFVAWTNYQPDESGLYLSLGVASQGYRSQMSYNGSGWEDDFTSPMGIINLGYKLQFYSGFNIKGEVGYGWCEYAKVFTYGVTVGWTFN